MKLLILMMLLPISGYAQTINGFPISEINQEYIQVVGKTNNLGYLNNVRIDFGKQQKYTTQKTKHIIGTNGKKIKFESMIDALNFMSSYGYVMVEAHSVSAKDGVKHYYYIMRKSQN